MLVTPSAPLSPRSRTRRLVRSRTSSGYVPGAAMTLTPRGSRAPSDPARDAGLIRSLPQARSVIQVRQPDARMGLVADVDADQERCDPLNESAHRQLTRVDDAQTLHPPEDLGRRCLGLAIITTDQGVLVERRIQ